jgi:hypothetical protein
MGTLRVFCVFLILLAGCTLGMDRSQSRDDAGIAGAESPDASGGNGEQRGNGGAGGAGGETGEGDTDTGTGGASVEGGGDGGGGTAAVAGRPLPGFAGASGKSGAGGAPVIADGGDLSDRAVARDKRCWEGYYEGGFSGVYTSQVIILATMGIWTSIPVAGEVKFNMAPNPGSNGDSFTVSDGQFAGAAMDMFPFFAELHGELDCEASRFEGALKNGYYEIGTDKYAFQGIARSLYDSANLAIVSGVWSVTKPAGSATGFPDPIDVQPGVPPDSQFPVGFSGGTGEWDAVFLSETPQ